MTQYRSDRNEYLAHNKTIYEVVMLADKEGNISGGGNFTGAGVDAFGRARFSQPVTLFDSQHIFDENSQFSESTSGTTTTQYLTNESSYEMTVDTASGDEVIRESKRVMPYQPGKSLLILNSFTMNEAKTNLRQRVGYFSSQNGIYVEQDDNTVYIVKRSYTSGSVVETRIAQSNWNGDTLDGNATTSTSGYVLNMSKSQLMWIDIEWLGVGSVRVGFVINGQFIIAHTFHHANLGTSTYMTTACLPIRYEITNTDATATSSTMRQICSTAISEGGYDARAIERSAGTALTGTSIDTAYESLMSIRLKSGRLNSIVVPAGVDVLNVANTDFEYALFLNATPTTPFASWTSGSDAVEYSLTNSTFSSIGTQILSGYLGGKTAPANIGDGFAWEYQLGRTLAGVSDVITLAARAKSNSSAIAGRMKWYELI